MGGGGGASSLPAQPRTRLQGNDRGGLGGTAPHHPHQGDQRTLATEAASTKGLGKPLRSLDILRSSPVERKMAIRRLQKMWEGEQTWLPHAWLDTVVGLEVLLASRQTLVVWGMEN
ncbi:unnamed protein product [Rangifer tarandus platyrhynchus]|uniref:Uncharacterized protein n=1 Tax=Rangifer tarandus platyrhynchus TaxID=3082113 RepID=A0AC59YJU4_RANTA